MPTILEDQFDSMFETPMERSMRQAEERIYNSPDGWKYLASSAISDINSRLQIQWGHDPLTRQEMNELGEVVRQRIARKVSPVWSEEWTEFIIENIIKRDGVRPSQVTAEVVTGDATFKASKDEVDEIIEQSNADEEGFDATDDGSAES